MANNKLVLAVMLIMLFLVSCNGNTETDYVEDHTDSITATEDDLVIMVVELSDKIKQDSLSPNLFYQRAGLYINLNKYQLGLMDMERALELDSLNPKYYDRLGAIYWNLKSSRGAIDAYERRKLLDTNDVNTYLRLGEIYLYLPDREQSFKNLNAILRKDRYNARAYFLKGMNYKEMGDTQRAISSFQTSVEVKPEFYDGYIQLGLLFLNRNLSLSEDYFKNALNLQPESVEALYNLGWTYQQMDSLEKAISNYKLILTKHPNHRNANYNLGFLNYVKGDFEKARDHFSAALDADSTYTSAWYSRGRTFLQLGQRENAEHDFRMALAIDPGFEAAQIELREMAEKKSLK